jgi:hypothetical protein
MASVFDVLNEIRKRPGLYVGGDESARLLQLQNLEQLLCGYSLALRNHAMQEPAAEFLREFGAFILRTRGWSVSCGPVAAIREAVDNDEEAWRLFWVLVDEFRLTFEKH